MCSRKNALCRAADSVLPFPASPRSPSGSPPENAQTRSEPAKSDNRTSTRERTNGDLDPRRNRNETYRKPSCLALMRQTAGVIERKTFRENREKSVIRDARSNSPNPARLATGTQNAACGARLSRRAPKRTLPPGFQRIRLISPFSRDEPSAGRTQNAAREPHRRAEQPPRPPTLRPELKPAKRNIAPAHDSRPHEAERRSAASARDSPRFQTKAAAGGRPRGITFPSQPSLPRRAR